MSSQVFPEKDAGAAEEKPSDISAETYPLAASLAGLTFADRKTALLVHGALEDSGIGAAAIRLAHQYLADADVLGLLTALRRGYGFIFAHGLRTMKLSMPVARQIGADDNERAILAVGAMLHDIGNLQVPLSLLMLQRRLRGVEIDRIRSHAEAGYDLLSDKRIFGWNSVLEIVRHHHEYLDGSGYPFGLDAGRISWRTRCITVCDVLGALTEARPYRRAMGRDEAFSVLAGMAAAGKLDRDIVNALSSATPF